MTSDQSSSSTPEELTLTLNIAGKTNVSDEICPTTVGFEEVAL